MGNDIKTWGTNSVVQEIRRRLRILKLETGTDKDLQDTYNGAIDDALDVIRKVMHNDSRVRKHKKG